ncbi:MAG: ArsR family transcriptional regulator [Kiritimatiellales bacterium]|nr:ArsR family transcriptional regulator [Kiritimatiellales bacterium]
MAMNNGEKVSLWRLCRTLANPVRLEMIGLFFQYNQLCVFETAELLGIGEGAASKHLQLLIAAGLLEFQRKGRYLLCSLATTGRTSHILAGIREIFEEHKEPIGAVIGIATAFTHERRVALVRLLSKGHCNQLQLYEGTGISGRALTRHLNKLVRRGFVGRVGDGFRMVEPTGMLAKELIKYCCN